MRAVRGHNDEVLPAMHLAIDGHPHLPRAIRRDRDERADEIAERRADDARARDDALGDMAVDPHARGVEEDAAVHIADIDATRARLREEREELLALAWIAERAREVIARSDRAQRERDIAAHKTVRDLIRGAIAADRDDTLVAILDRGRWRTRRLAV